MNSSYCPLKRVSRIGYQTLLTFILGFLGLAIWSYLAPISSATLAPGHIRAEGLRQTIQNYDRGIIEKILVDNGDRVKRGDVLLVLEDDELLAQQRSLLEELLSIMLDQDYYDAIIQQHETFKIRSKTRSLASALALSHRIVTLKKEWQAEHQTHKSAENLINLQKRLTQQQLHAQQQLLGNLEHRKALLVRDSKALESLTPKAYVSVSQRNQVTYTLLEIDSEINDANNSISQINTRQLQFEEQHIHNYNERLQKASDEWWRLNRYHAKLVKELAIVQQKIKRKIIRAPVSGRINQLNVNAIGSTVEPHIELMEIIPKEARLIVEAKISANDIDTMHQKTTAFVRLNALNPRRYAPFPATILELSPDLVSHSGEPPLYRLTLEIDPQATYQYDVTLYPGMQVNVIIETGERTLYDYLIGSALQSSETAMRERNL